eukprot:4793408-Pyramimonas_sp.AAC.1
MAMVRARPPKPRCRGAAWVVVGCSRLGLPLSSRKSAWGLRRQYFVGGLQECRNAGRNDVSTRPPLEQKYRCKCPCGTAWLCTFLRANPVHPDVPPCP